MLRIFRTETVLNFSCAIEGRGAGGATLVFPGAKHESYRSRIGSRLEPNARISKRSNGRRRHDVPRDRTRSCAARSPHGPAGEQCASTGSSCIHSSKARCGEMSAGNGLRMSPCGLPQPRCSAWPSARWTVVTGCLMHATERLNREVRCSTEPTRYSLPPSLESSSKVRPSGNRSSPASSQAQLRWMASATGPS